MPKVSIVLPTYNGEKYIKEAITYIINQSFEDWELIIVNDCSTDNTKIIVEEIISREPRIRLINNSVNKKIPYSLNKGFKEAKGEYLTWTSDDNYYLPNAILEMSHFLDKNKEYPMVCTKMDIVDDSGKFLRESNGYDSEKMYFDNYVGASFLYRRSVLEDVGQYNIEKFLIEDYDYWFRILKFYGQIGYIDKILYRYREHLQSLSSRRKIEIKKRLLKYRYENLSTITEKLYNKQELLSFVFYEFYEGNFNMTDIKGALENYVDVIKKDGCWETDKKTIVYGAGEYGTRAWRILGDRAVFFVDKDMTKVGKRKHGIEIISVDYMVEIQEQYNICIAVSFSSIYKVVKELESKGVSRFVSYYWISEYLGISEMNSKG